MINKFVSDPKTDNIILIFTLESRPTIVSEILYFEKHICVVLQYLGYVYTDANSFEFSFIESIWLTRRPMGASGELLSLPFLRIW